MPRRAIKIAPKVEFLSILDEQGQIDASLDPKLDGDTLLRMYRSMLLTRRADERAIKLQRQGRMGTYGPTQGQEAAHIGPGFAVGPDDWCIQAFREAGLALLRGWPIQNLYWFWGGYEEGNEIPEGVNDVPICVPVASQLLHAVGVAWGMKIRKKTNVVLGFVGDGGTSEGDFHEALNFAGVFQLPVVFVVQNNHWAISIPRANQTQSTTLAQKAISYGFDGMQVDGNDILATYAATAEAVEKARKGGGPTLLEMVTYRMGVHTTADDPTKYRKEEEVAKWKNRDPITRLAKYLTAKGLLDEKTIAELEADVEAQVKRGVEEYENIGQVSPLDAFDHVYAELPAELSEQQAEFEAALASESR